MRSIFFTSTGAEEDNKTSFFFFSFPILYVVKHFSLLLELRTEEKIFNATFINDSAEFASDFSKSLLLSLISKGSLEVVDEV